MGYVIAPTGVGVAGVAAEEVEITAAVAGVVGRTEGGGCSGLFAP